MMSQAEIQAKIAKWQKALDEQNLIIKEHENKARYCKIIIESLQGDLAFYDKMQDRIEFEAY
jgi:hypothetical protein